jgi:transcriptional regulator with XRE-family HTH domain
MKDKVGSKLLEIRLERGLIQAEMADLLGIPESTYQNYELNKSKVDYQKLTEFAKKLKVGVHEFFPESSSTTNNNSNSGQGGGVNFGTQNFYLGNEVVNSALTKENEELRGKLNDLESKLHEFMERFPKSE